LPVLPETWPDRYERLVADHDIQARTFDAAIRLVHGLWGAMIRPDPKIGH
jgi:hypothetical protein